MDRKRTMSRKKKKGNSVCKRLRAKIKRLCRQVSEKKVRECIKEGGRRDIHDRSKEKKEKTGRADPRSGRNGEGGRGGDPPQNKKECRRI